MTRYIPNQVGSFDPLRASGRPPAAALDPALVKLVTERDALLVSHRDARKTVERLASEVRDAEAQRADDQAAAVAVRAGKALPKPVAVPQLATDRETAARTLAALEDALTTVTNEANQVRYDAAEASAGTLAARRQELAEQLHAQASDLASAVESGVAELATLEWLDTGRYYPAAQVWATDAVHQLRSHGLDRSNAGAAVDVRSILIAATTAVVTTEGD